jgi:hypothetical protein
MQRSDLKNNSTYVLSVTNKYATVSVAHEGYYSKMHDTYVGGHTNESVKVGVHVKLFKLDESDVKKTAEEFAEKCTALEAALTNLGLSYDQNITDFVRQKAVIVRTSLKVEKSDVMSDVYIPDPRIEEGAWFLSPHTTWSGNFSANFYNAGVYLHADGCQPYYAARANAVVDHMGSWWLAGSGEDKSGHLHELLDRLITTPKATEVEEEVEIEGQGELASEEQLTSLLAKFKK